MSETNAKLTWRERPGDIILIVLAALTAIVMAFVCWFLFWPSPDEQPVRASAPLSSATPAPSVTTVTQETSVAEDDPTEQTAEETASDPSATVAATPVATSQPTASATPTAVETPSDTPSDPPSDPDEVVLEDPPLTVVTVPDDDGDASSQSSTIIPWSELDEICQSIGASGVSVPAGATVLTQVFCADGGTPIAFDPASLYDACPRGTIIIQDDTVICRTDG